MSARRFLTVLGLALGAISCGDANAPTALQRAPNLAPAALTDAATGSSLHPLKQAPSAPQLETYQLSFWAFKGKSSSARVQYQTPIGGTSNNFLQFTIPKTGLVSGANGARLRTGDSLQIALNIDPTSFLVSFQPSGVQFSTSTPATLRMWYQNADPDLNGDGVVDDSDTALSLKLGMWTSPDSFDSWARMSYILDPSGKSITANVYHFSGYSVAW